MGDRAGSSPVIRSEFEEDLYEEKRTGFDADIGCHRGSPFFEHFTPS